ncbi:MAG: hypothetical protein KDD22_03590 [Bdellovibrionales bacterium]|nr:hypothetical protein [Bdellovibrionales bacterium]
MVGQGSARGSLKLSGEGFMSQTYELQLTDRLDEAPKKFNGTVYLKGQMEFTELSPDTQEAMTSAMKMSRRPNLKSGSLLVFSNVKDNDDVSTLTLY